MWIANIMRNTDEKLWVAPRDTPQMDSIGTDWIDSGITLPSTEGYIKGMAVSNKCPLLMQPCDVGGNTANPVGDC
ncbi:MAG: hypothetical protein RSD54_09480, partial [Ruthenibacterium sp.]